MRKHIITATVTATPAAYGWTTSKAEATGEEIAARLQEFLVARYGASAPVWVDNGETWTVALHDMAFTVTTEEVTGEREADNTTDLDKVAVATSEPTPAV